MNKIILSYIENLENKKLAVKQLHWDAKNLSQHKLCDDIADRIADFQDQVSEVEQSMSGKLPLNKFKPSEYKVEGLKPFVEDVISDAKKFLKQLEKMGDDYVGMKSDCESFISDMQRNLYLVNFTLKENMKKRIKSMLSERMYKNIPKEDKDGNKNFDKQKGRRPKSIKARIDRIYKIVDKYGLGSRKYGGENWQAIDDYISVIESLGCEVECWCEDGGYTDYDPTYGMNMSKEYKIKISYDDGMVIGGIIKCMACGTVKYPFSKYDTSIVLWPKPLNESVSIRNIRPIYEAFATEDKEFYFTAEVEVEDIWNERSRVVVLPFVCSVRYAEPELDVNYGGELDINDIQLDMKHSKGLLSAEEGSWVVNEWIPNNLDYLEEVAQKQFMEEVGYDNGWYRNN